MNETNKRRAAALGMPTATANSQLRKMLLFSALQKLGEDLCYRCESRIETIEELSVEHKTSWLYAANPKEMFFNLDNISFSHLICNVKAGSKVGPDGESWNKGRPSPRKGVSSGLNTVAPQGLLYCTNHQQYLPVKLFHKDNSSGTGFKNLCTGCRRVYRQQRYKENKSR